jgi:hypothetical protein
MTGNRQTTLAFRIEWDLHELGDKSPASRSQPSVPRPAPSASWGPRRAPSAARRNDTAVRIEKEAVP